MSKTKYSDYQKEIYYISKSIKDKYSDGLLFGSGLISELNNRLSKALIFGYSDQEIENIARDYDFLEIEPVENCKHYIDEGILKNDDEIISIIKKIITLGEKLNIPVCATGNVDFINKEDSICKKVLLFQIGEEWNGQYGYLMSTSEMLDAFSFLGKEKAYEVVVTNTNKIADMCNYIEPISQERALPHFENENNEIKEKVYEKAHKIYGDNLPKEVQERVEKELNAIIKYEYSYIFLTAQKLVDYSKKLGYPVNSRGLVASSIVAYLLGITEINPLKPHYICSKCSKTFFPKTMASTGYDLPDKKCSHCKSKMLKEGFDIPVEFFWGLNGDKEPDIDLNFSAIIRNKVISYARKIFGKNNVFIPSTIGTIFDRTAEKFLNKYISFNEVNIDNEKREKIIQQLIGVKKAEGIHPGGIIVVPKDRKITEFSPLQYAHGTKKLATHYDYHSIDWNLVKFDILAHDDSTIIYELEKATKYDIDKIPMDDKKTLSLFSSEKAFNVKSSDIYYEFGTSGIPEFNTKFVRNILKLTNPKTFNDLIKISALSHGTGTWINNAYRLITENKATLEEVISSRDDIFYYLKNKGLDEDISFKIAEFVRKGKAEFHLKSNRLLQKDREIQWNNYTNIMIENGVPEWYIDSCQKIKYLFPRAHATSYVRYSYIMAWFKLNYPKEFYNIVFKIKYKTNLKQFAIKHNKNEITKEIDKTLREIQSQDDKEYDYDEISKLESKFDKLQLLNEMYERGVEI